MVKTIYHNTAASEDIHWCFAERRFIGEKLPLDYLDQDYRSGEVPHALGSGRLRISGEI